jgi:hypothetical protein
MFTTYLHAVSISELLAKLSFLLPVRNGNKSDGACADSGYSAVAARKEQVMSLMTRLADELLRPYDSPAAVRLLCPERLFSLAIWISEEYLPDDFSPEEWRDCCARASMRRLGLIHRDPHRRLDPSWLATDPDLEPPGLPRGDELGVDCVH